MSSLTQEIENTIKAAMPDAQVIVSDPMNDNTHLEAIVISPSFEGKTRVQQHQMVMKPLREHFASGLHALALKTYRPDQWTQK
jgi:stress-induced morphogen